MKAINLNFGFTRPRNPEHYQMHHDMLEVITVEFVTAFGIAALREEYQRLFDIENDCYLRNAAYQDTPELQAADRKRDDLFLYCSQTISTAERSPPGIRLQHSRGNGFCRENARNNQCC